MIRQLFRPNYLNGRRNANILVGRYVSTMFAMAIFTRSTIFPFPRFSDRFNVKYMRLGSVSKGLFLV